MLDKLRDAVIASVRLRASQGDCPTEPAHSVETLESVILDLAPAVDAVPAGEVAKKPRLCGICTRSGWCRQYYRSCDTQKAERAALSHGEGRK